MDFGDAERKRSFELNMWIGLAGFAFLLAFGVNSLLNQQTGHATSLLLTASVVLLSLMAMWWSGQPVQGATGLSIAAGFMFLYLIVSGGTDGTGPLWCYPIVAVITFLQGLRRGTYVLLALIAVASMLFFMPSLPFATMEYPDSFKSRFLFSFSALAIMALIYEHLRGQSQVSYQELSDQLDRASRTDDLTGLDNRREMRELLDTEEAIFRRYGHVFSVVMADLDWFKLKNDRHGHAFGDKLLVAVASCFRDNVRELDRASRWGGEEFLILLPQTRLDDAAVVAEKLRVAVSRLTMRQGDTREQVTASFGVQSIEQATGIDDLIRRADDCLYQAKHLGRNRVVTEINALGDDQKAG